MVASVKQLTSDPNFWLKLISFILSICLLAFAHQYLILPVTRGYIGTCCGITFALLIACILEKTTKLTEICLLIVALVKVFISTVVFVNNYQERPDWPDHYPRDRYILTPSKTEFAVHLVLSICAIIVIAIDVILRAKKD